MITAVLLGPGVVAVLTLILVVTTRIEHHMAGREAAGEAPEHAR